jgi:hypothetical protein
MQSWEINVMFFSKRKPKVACRDVAKLLADGFCEHLDKEFSMPPISIVGTDLLQTESATGQQEWVILLMFLRTPAFRAYGKNAPAIKTILDCFHGTAASALVARGILNSTMASQAAVHHRYREYFQAIHGSRNIQFQLMRVSEAFLKQCHINSLGTVLVVSEHVMHAYIAEKNLRETLERENDFVNVE